MGTDRRSRPDHWDQLAATARERNAFIADMVRAYNGAPMIPCDYITGGPAGEDRCQQPADWMLVLDHSCSDKHAFVCDLHRGIFIAAQPLMCYGCNRQPVNIVLWEPLR